MDETEDVTNTKFKYENWNTGLEQVSEETWKQKKGVVARDGPPALCHSVCKLRGRHDVERGLASGEKGHPSLDHGVAV